jgi:hypothetical protein
MARTNTWPSLRRLGAFACSVVLWVLDGGGGGLPGVHGILRGDETQKLAADLNRYRVKLESLQEGTPERTETLAHFHALQHKLRAMDFFDHGMTQADYDEFTALVDREKELFARHERDNFVAEERVELAAVQKKVNTFTQK